MGKKKKKKEEAMPAVTEEELLKPIDILSLGSDSDPCFGKQYDLTTEECSRCGDSELCAIAHSQKLNIIRKDIEKEKSFKDIDEVKVGKEIKFIKKLIKKGKKPSEILKKVVDKFEIPKSEARKLYKSIK